MIPQGILGLLQGQQGLQQAGGAAPQNPGMLLGGTMPTQPQQMPQGAPLGGQPMAMQRPGMPGGATGAPQAGQLPTGPATPGATGMPVGGAPQGLLPNMTPGQANAISTGMNTAMASMPHGAGGQGPQAGMTAQGVMQALGGGMGAGMNPQLMQLMQRGGGYGTA